MTGVGTWNVQYGHPVRRHAALIVRRFRSNGLDVLALQEVADYGDELETEAARHGFLLVRVRGAGPKAQQAILVRDPERVEGSWCFQAGPGWTAPNGDGRGPMYPLAVKYDGVLYVSVHAPVSVRWQPAKPFRITGPARRVLAYRGHSRRLLRVFRAHGRVVMLGDWNATPDARGAWTPRWLARKAGATIARPGRSTGHGEIDYAIVRGVDMPAMYASTRGRFVYSSDHLMVTGKVKPTLVQS